MNQTISARINTLAACLLLALTAVSVEGWHALATNAASNAAAAQRIAGYERSVNAARVAQVSFKIQVQEWKNILLRGDSAEAFAKYSKQFEEMARATQAALDDLKTSDQELALDVAAIDELLVAHQELGAKYQSALKLYDAAAPGTAHVVDARVKGLDRSLNDKLDHVVAAARERMESTTEPRSAM